MVVKELCSSEHFINRLCCNQRRRPPYYTGKIDISLTEHIPPLVATEADIQGTIPETDICSIGHLTNITQGG